MATNDQDARALTYLARRLRDETHGCGKWDDAGTYAVIARLIGQNLALTCERVLRHAADPEARTPGAIERPFVPPAPGPQPRFPAKAGKDCREHRGEWADGCRACAADRLVGERDDTSSSADEGRALRDQIRARREAHAGPHAAPETETAPTDTKHLAAKK